MRRDTLRHSAHLATLDAGGGSPGTMRVGCDRSLTTRGAGPPADLVYLIRFSTPPARVVCGKPTEIA